LVVRVFFAPKMQPVWHHFASTQRPKSMASGTRSQVCPAASSVAAHSPPDFETSFQEGWRTLRPRSARRYQLFICERAIARGHMRRSGPSSGWWSRRSNVSRGARIEAAR
jgi:hypothetical protein